MRSTELYRKIHRGNAGDVDFYVRACRGAHRVLELGCGWGRMTLPLARAGHSVLGVDLEEEFLKIARSSSHSDASFLLADITNLGQDFVRSHRQSFDRVLLPYNTMYALGGKAGVERCLRDAVGCLAAEGEVWFDVYPIDELHEALEDGEEIPDDDCEPVASFEHDGSLVQVFESTRFDPANQSLHVVYDARSASQLVGTLEMNHHYLTQAQVLACLEQVDLVPLASLSGFSDDATDDEDPPWVVGATIV